MYHHIKQLWNLMTIGKLVWVRNASFIRLQVAMYDTEKARYYKQEAVNKHFFPFCN